MFLREVIDTGVWNSLQDAFSEIVGFPLLTVDLMGNVLFGSGKYPFFCELVLKKGEQFCGMSRKDAFDKLPKTAENSGYLKFQCHSGLTNIMSPIYVDNKLAGAFLCSSIRSEEDIFGEVVKTAKFVKIETDELLDEIRRLPKTDSSQVERIGKVLCLMSKIIPDAAKRSFDSNKKIRKLSFLNRFAKSVYSCLDLNKLLENSAKSILKEFGLADCSITLYDRSVRMNENQDCIELKEKIEKNNFTQVRNSKTPIFVSDAREDFILSSIEGIKSFDYSIYGIPLLQGSNLVGMLTAYGHVGELNLKKDNLLNVSEILASAITNAKKLAASETSAITDPLTGLYNKGYFIENLKNEIARASNFKRATSLIILDLDKFKNYNDNYGHPAGDKLLKQVGKILQDNIGAIDSACRYGGEEFAIILPETKPEHAFLLGEKLRMNIANFPFDNRKITISVGIATCLNSSVSGDVLLKETDKALYKSKNTGRNKVTNFVIVDKNLNPIDMQEANSLGKIGNQ